MKNKIQEKFLYKIFIFLFEILFINEQIIF